MKSMYWKTGALAATLAIAVTTVSAQPGNSLMASIPFSFQAGEHHFLQPGQYNVKRNGTVWAFTNTGTRKQTLVPSLYSAPGERKDKARLVFECRANRTACSLRSIWPGSGELGGYWATPKTGKADSDQTASIVVINASVAR